MSGAAPQGIFDSEESVLKALSVIRNSTLKVAEKSHLRDLFLDYAGEVSEDRRNTLRQEIFNQLQPHAAALPTLLIPNEPTSANNESKEESSVSSALGVRRPVPSFRAPVSAEIISNTQPTSSTVESTEPTPAEAPEVNKTAPQSEVVDVPAAAPVDLRARIDAIKHDINGKVGNPVNLINADEKIGREYMSALLGAMKSASGGGGEAPASARLESAYRAALALIEKMPADSVPKTSATNSEPEKSSPQVDEETAPLTTSTPDITPEPIAPNIEEPAISVTDTEDSPAAEVPPKPEPTKSWGLYHQPVDDTDQILEEEKETTPEDVEEKATASPTERRLKIGESPLSTPKAEGERAPLHSLKDEMALPEQMAKVKADSAKREAAAKKPITDLNSPEVQTGLEQLLSEWKLFHSSGFLGTGPKGINHALYKKLANLPMAAVVAGRFEGVTPDIKQSLTDYMNGWRYEQGIVHEMGETFEHYLRRVIKQILTRQRLSISS